MKIEQMKTSWQGYSKSKKWLVGGGAALLLIAVAGAGEDQNGRGGGPHFMPQAAAGQPQGGPGYAPGYPGGGYAGDQGAGYAAQPGYAPQAGYAAQPGYPAGGQYGGGYVAPSSAPVDVTSGYEAQQRSQDISARAFGQYIRDETDVTDAQTGQITTNVPNEIANPAIESGSYSATPAADVAAATEASE